MAECLSNAVVLRKLFQHISNPELLKLSLVNKVWCHEARSVIKNRGNLIARLKFRDDQPCQEYLDTFAEDLQRMKVVPFSGIRIQLGHSNHVCQVPALASTYHTILDQLPLRNVTLALAGELSKNRDCPGSVLARTALTRCSGVLEEVSLVHVGPQQTILVGYVQDCSFAKLKILKLGENYEKYDPTYTTDVLRALVSSAPKLQELHGQGPINLMCNVLEGRSTVFVYQSVVSAPFDEIPDRFINRIRLQDINLHYGGPDFNVERFNRITPMLLQGPSSAALYSMHLDGFLAVPLMCFGIRIGTVRHLQMEINPVQMELAEPRILRILKHFDFTRMFPNLERVTIFAPPFDVVEVDPDHMNGFVEQANASLKDPLPDRAINIKELDISTSLTSANAEFYAEMFPQTEKLRLKEENGTISFGSIWKHWTNLKVLDVMADSEKHYEDLDSVICGIFPEEVAELREKDEEFLKKVNIVPVMPAITCLRNLEKFILILVPLSHRTFGFPGLGYVEPPPSLIMSKVAGLVAFARCPNLSVTLSTYVSNVYEGLKHMKPYASVYHMVPAAAERLN